MNMKKSLLWVAVALAFASCTATKTNTYPGSINFIDNDPPITQSLFEDKSATISEENIQRILDGTYSLPEDLSVAFVRIAPSQSLQRYYWSDEEYLKSQQQYLDLFSEKFKNSSRVKKTFSIPDLLISSAPSFTSIRGSAVRTQSDIVVIYSINSDIYSQYKLFSKTDIKAFATTQLVILDVRTGLIPFTTIVTKDFQDKKTDADLNENEARNRIKNQAVLGTIEEIGLQLEAFLGK
ncbi:hypothetical protein [Cyclobacterium sp.]|uniref:hypothetical protein n=1 Tax=Cyclobacterium sp. TaxID=1966343 RepID=UPI0025BE549A|nr:hypothetical protein [Cyclobacterium sp.]